MGCDKVKRVMRKRGRPVTTGAYAIKKIEMTLKEKVKILQNVVDINNPDLEPPKTRGIDKMALERKRFWRTK